jgi:hypothetical protein
MRTPDPEYDNYTIDLYPDDAGIETIKEAGLGIEPRIKDDRTFYKFRRPDTKMIKGELVKFGPPKVVKATGEEKDGIPVTEPFDGLIGNGSKVTIKVATYDAGKFRGHRLEGVRVDDLVVYNPDGATREPTEEYPF